MRLTEYSLLMAILWSDATLLLVFLMRHRLWFVRAFSVKTVLLLYGGCLFRLSANMEFNSVTEISLPQMNFIGDFFNRSILVGSFYIPITHLLVIIWSFGSLAFLLHIAVAYIRDLKKLILPCASEQITQCLADIVEAKDQDKIIVVMSNEINSPCISGIFHGIIYLPERRWEKKKLRLILAHEYAHFKNHDLLITLLVNVFVAVFWWNPPVYLLKMHLSEILEFKADNYVINHCNNSEARYYCKAMIAFSEKSSENKKYFSMSALEHRVSRILLCPISKLRQSVAFAFIALYMLITLTASYVVILQPAYQEPTSDYTEIPLKRGSIASDSDNGMSVVIGGSEFFLTENQEDTILSNDYKGD